MKHEENHNNNIYWNLQWKQQNDNSTSNNILRTITNYLNIVSWSSVHNYRLQQITIKKHQNEILIVHNSNTGINKRTMMVHFQYTLITLRAMMASVRLVGSAGSAVTWLANSSLFCLGFLIVNENSFVDVINVHIGSWAWWIFYFL